MTQMRCYWVVINTDPMLQDPELCPFVLSPALHVVMGSLRTWVCVVQRVKKEYNLVLIHPDDVSVESWTEEGS